MRGRVLVSNLIGVAVILAAGSALADPAPPRLTADQAILIARDYCHSIGQPVTDPGTATFPVAADPWHDPREPDSYWRPRWKVTFLNQATVQVVDETGVVRDYRNDVWTFDHGLPAPGAVEISAMKAGQIATDALRKTGHPMDELVLAAVQPDRISPPSSPNRIWGVRFDRVFHGVPYADQGAGALVEYRGGRLDG
ncbi:MAG TPA: hypothetical protein VFJ58_00775, partial [Armatimonadota bacterium]|nr:hypothetical protein [Armatimonadota bacterium]